MVFRELKIRDLAIGPAHILAPMAGITDTVFRRFIKRLGGCGLIMTEFVSSEGMIRPSFRTQRYLYYTEEERPISAQIFGADPAHLADLAITAALRRPAENRPVDLHPRARACNSVPWAAGGMTRPSSGPWA